MCGGWSSAPGAGTQNGTYESPGSTVGARLTGFGMLKAVKWRERERERERLD